MKKSRDDKALTLMLEFSKLSEAEKETFLRAINQFIVSAPQVRRQILKSIHSDSTTQTLKNAGNPLAP